MILGAAGGDQERRETFSRLYAPVIRSYFAARWRLPSDHEDVVDATQDVFVQFFKDDGALQRVDPECSGGFRAYLYGVAHNVSLMAERKFARRKRSENTESVVDLATVPRSDATLSQVFDKAWAKAVARDARRRLAERSTTDTRASERFRCLELRYSAGLAPKEIADKIELTVNDVYERLREARKAYRLALFEVVAEQNPSASRAELEGLCRELVTLL